MALVATLVRGAGAARQLMAVAHASPSRLFVTLAPALNTALKPFLMKKITTEFDHIYDTNGDGVTDLQEIEDFKKRLESFIESRQECRFKDDYSGMIDEYWKVVSSLCQHDKNGGITRESWIHMWEHIILTTGPDKYYTAMPLVLKLMPRALFPLIDSSGDGVIDKQEYADYWQHIGRYPKPSTKALDHIFADLTENGYYRLDIQRVEDLYADFYLSSDINTAGKYICGPIDFSEFIIT